MTQWGDNPNQGSEEPDPWAQPPQQPEQPQYGQPPAQPDPWAAQPPQQRPQPARA